MKKVRSLIRYSELLALAALVAASGAATYKWFYVPWIVQSELHDAADAECYKLRNQKCRYVDRKLVFDKTSGSVGTTYTIFIYKGGTPKEGALVARAIRLALHTAAKKLSAGQQAAVAPYLDPMVRYDQR